MGIHILNPWIIASLTATNNANLPDACQILDRGETQGDYGPEPTWTPREDPPGTALSLPCRFSHLDSDELVPLAELSVVQAQVALAKGVIVGNEDRIRLTHKDGEALSAPQDYDIVGAPQYLSTMTFLALKSTTL